jgi:hypothetical protein
VVTCEIALTHQRIESDELIAAWKPTKYAKQAAVAWPPFLLVRESIACTAALAQYSTAEEW